MQRSTLVCQRGTSWLVQSQLDTKNCVSSASVWKKLKWENFILEITIFKGRQRISRYQQSVCMNIWKRCLSDYNVLDCSNCISEDINWKQRKIKSVTSLHRERITANWSTQFIFCFFVRKATKHKYGGIPSVFGKTLELKFSCVRNDRIHSCDHWVLYIEYRWLCSSCLRQHCALV